MHHTKAFWFEAKACLKQNVRKISHQWSCWCEIV